MQKWTHTLLLDNNFDSKKQTLLDKFFTEDSLFFDIETTGFSPANTQVYLIGCARRNGSQIIIEQYFAESNKDERCILTSFLTLLERYHTIITFNGIGFDIPYIKAKCKQYQLTESFDNKEYIDLFKIASRLKFLLKLPNYKQKSIEDFLGIRRNDLFDGGELIRIYQEYVKTPSEKQLFYLKQHNYEDVLGMLDLLEIISYHNFIHGDYFISSIESNLYTNYEGTETKELIITLDINQPLSKRVSCHYEDCYLTAADNHAKLKIRLFEGELKFFFDNYKDYYYLPLEDTAHHKDIAFCVDKMHRKKATAATCYTKKESLFLPQYQTITKPAFYKNYKDKISYFELCDNFINSGSLLRQYVEHILHAMSSQKK